MNLYYANDFAKPIRSLPQFHAVALRYQLAFCGTVATVAVPQYHTLRCPVALPQSGPQPRGSTVRHAPPPRQMPVLPPSSPTKFTQIWPGISRRPYTTRLLRYNVERTLFVCGPTHNVVGLIGDRLSDSTLYSLRVMHTPLNVHGAQLLSIGRLHIPASALE